MERTSDFYTASAFPLDFGTGLPGSGRNETDAWNYFHINSVDKDDEGNYLISARNIAALFKINGTSGDIIWQLGGFQGGSSFDLADEDHFAFQHHARFRGRSADGDIEHVSFFDNGAHSAPIKTHPFSRARIYQLNHTDGSAKSLRTFNAPDGLSARTQGSVQPLANGNVFVNWGEAGAVTEFKDDGEILFHAYLDSAPRAFMVQSYRGFRANWTGTPTEEPAIVAIRGEGGDPSGLDVYVSWNGDTETRSWRFYASQITEDGSTTSQQTLVGEVKRDGFETKLSLKGEAKHVLVSAQAIGADGKPLRRTRNVPVSEFSAKPPVQTPEFVLQFNPEL